MIRRGLELIFMPLWMWLNFIPTVSGIVLWFRPDLEKFLAFSEITRKISGYHLVTFGLITWLLSIAWKAAKRIGELEDELVEVDVVLEPGTESYLGNPIVYLLITNHEDFDLRDCYCTLTRLEHKWRNDESDRQIYGKDFRRVDALVYINRNRRKLRWAAFPVEEEKIVHSGRESAERIDIAKISDGKLLFIFEGQEDDAIHHGEYYVEVEFGGYMQGKQIRKKRFCGTLRSVEREITSLPPTIKTGDVTVAEPGEPTTSSIRDLYLHETECRGKLPPKPQSKLVQFLRRRDQR